MFYWQNLPTVINQLPCLFSHRPADTVFHEVWLHNVIQNKLAITESLNLMAVQNLDFKADHL